MSILNISVEAFDPLTAYFEGREVIDKSIIDSIPDDVVESVRVLRIPEGVTELAGDFLFAAFSIEKIILPRSIREIGRFVFANLFSLKEINLEDCINLEGIDQSTFRGCNNLREITLPEGITYINMEAFVGCTSLRCIVVPSMVNFIGKSAFENCVSLEVADLGACTEILYLPFGLFTNCHRLREVILPPNCTYLGNNVFLKCGSLKEFIAPEVSEIGVCCFSYCTSLHTVELAPLTIVRYQAFNKCYSLTETRFICFGGAPENAFNQCYALKEISVQRDSAGKLEAPDMPWAHIKTVSRNVSTIDLIVDTELTNG